MTDMATVPQRLLAKLVASPLAIAPRALDLLLASTTLSYGVDTEASVGADDTGWDLEEGGIAVVPVFGPLLQRGDDFTRWLGIATYDELGDTIESALASPDVRGVLLEIDSPGGVVSGLFDLLDRVAQMKAASGKPIWSIARDLAVSAAYAIASTADRIIVTHTGEVGSIGVLAVMIDKTAADKMDGRKYALIHAGAKKIDGNPHVPLSPGAAADAQADVDDLYAQFVSRVATQRRMSPQAVAVTEAAIYRGQHALDAGLADRIASMEAAVAEFATVLNTPSRSRQTGFPTATILTQTTTERTEPMAKPANAKPAAQTAATPAAAAATPVDQPAVTPAAPGAVTTAPTTPAAAQTSPAPTAEPVTFATAAQVDEGRTAPRQMTPEAIRAEAAEIAAIAAQAAKLGLAIDVAAAVTAATRPDALRQSVLEQLATKSAAQGIMPIAPAAPREPALIAAAKDAAKEAMTAS